MKKLFVITIIFLTSLGIQVKAGYDYGCYVKSGNKIYFGQKLKFGLSAVKVISDDGTQVEVPIKEVNAYMKDNRYFELRPTVNKNYEISGYAMMELLKTNCDLKLYRSLTKDSETPVYEYYVFNNDRFHLLLDKENAANVCAFFGIKARLEL